MSIHSIVYNIIFIPIAIIIKKIWQLFNPKLKERERNWKSSMEDMKPLESKLNAEESFVIWFHSASMGEFEQAKPVIEELKRTRENVIAVCSFFSPSGYNHQRHYPFADAVVYLPFDTKSNTKYFLRQVKPDIAVFVRYEIWRNFLEELKASKVPALLINATFPRSILLNFFKSFLRSTLNLFKEIYTINYKQTNKFNSLGLTTKVETLADTRFDRIIANIENAKTNPKFRYELFDESEFVIVAGSTWEPDEKLIFSAIDRLNSDGKELRLILVPHEPTENNIMRIRKLAKNSVLLSEIEKLPFPATPNELKDFVKGKIIIVDSVGKLLGLYRYAKVAYIGGAFGDGVHSVTEPAGYGIPLAAGSNISSSPDAVDLALLGCLHTIRDSNELYLWLKELMENPNEADQLGHIAKNYVYSRQGASKVISSRILELWNKS
jgi:3-deoxy-D-manno-octulosonic-acid transferase